MSALVLIEAMSKAMSDIQVVDDPNNPDWQTAHQVKHKRDEYLQSNGWTRIGQGAFKTVWAKDEMSFCVKTFAECFEDEGGAREVANYESAPESLKPYLLPILAHGRGWMIQEKLDILREDAYGHMHRRAICEKFNCPGWIEGMTDSGTTNHGHRADGTLVIFDYGQHHQWDEPKKKKEEAA